MENVARCIRSAAERPSRACFEVGLEMHDRILRREEPHQARQHLQDGVADLGRDDGRGAGVVLDLGQHAEIELDAALADRRQHLGAELAGVIDDAADPGRIVEFGLAGGGAVGIGQLVEQIAARRRAGASANISGSGGRLKPGTRHGREDYAASAVPGEALEPEIAETGQRADDSPPQRARDPVEADGEVAEGIGARGEAQLCSGRGCIVPSFSAGAAWIALQGDHARLGVLPVEPAARAGSSGPPRRGPRGCGRGRSSARCPSCIEDLEAAPPGAQLADLDVVREDVALVLVALEGAVAWRTNRAACPSPRGSR